MLTQGLGLIIHGVLLLSIVVAVVILTGSGRINGDAAVGLLGAVAATTAGTTAYRAGTRSSDERHRSGDSAGRDPGD
jgi:hypothetical protein